MEKELRQVLQRLDTKAKQLEKDAVKLFKKVEKKFDNRLMNECIGKRRQAVGIMYVINGVRQVYKSK